MSEQEIGEVYRNKADEELLCLALTPEQLTLEARSALDDELARRGINSVSYLDAARKQEQQRIAENERSIGTLGFLPNIGIGRVRFCRAGRVYNPETGVERFRTTVFILLFWLPLIPTGTYLVERKRNSPDPITVLEKLPLDWEQVLTVWVVTTGSILALIWLIRLASWALAHRYWR